MRARLEAMWIRLTTDKRRFGILCTLVGLGLLLWARLIVATNMPKMALADPQDEGPVIPGIDESGKRPVPIIEVAFDDDANRDPFAISPIHFPKRNDPSEKNEERTKSGADGDEDPGRAETALRRRLSQAVEELSLDAVMPTSGMALIDGRTYRRGNLVVVESNGQRWDFTVAEVRSRSVLLTFEDRRFELEMSGPGG